MSHDIKTNIKQQSTWKRGLYMLLFSVFYQVSMAVLFVIILFQFVLKLLTGEINEQLAQLSRSIASYVYQIIRFLSFNSEQHPYPFADWPQGEPAEVNKTQKNELDVDEVLKKTDQDIDVDGD